MRWSLVDSLEQLYAFSYNPRDDKISSSAGWVLYDPRLEFSRMEITSDTWQASDLNQEYKVCIYEISWCTNWNIEFNFYLEMI